MPCYVFSVDGDGSVETDEGGTVLSGPEAARATLVVFAGDLLREAGGRFWDPGQWRLQVTDEQGLVVCTLTITGTVGA